MREVANLEKGKLFKRKVRSESKKTDKVSALCTLRPPVVFFTPFPLDLMSRMNQNPSILYTK